MRLFLGIDLPDQVKSQLNVYVEPLKISNKGWEHPHDFHLTLLFIGEVDEEELKNIERKLQHIKFSPFILKAKSLEFFPRRILYLSFENNETIMRLKKLIDEYYPEYLRPNEKAFVPHLTVKRWQRYEYDQLSQGIQKLSQKNFSFVVQKLCLFKSEKNELGQKYHVIGESPGDSPKSN